MTRLPRYTHGVPRTEPDAAGIARSGFSLIELIVVLAILGLLFALVASGVQRVRAAAVRAACSNNLRQLAMGVHSYSAQAGVLPQGCGHPFATNGIPSTMHAGVSWHTAILPHIEQTAAWKIAWDAQVADPVGNDLAFHAAPLSLVIPTFLCPAESRTLGTDGLGGTWGLTSFVGVAGRGVRSDDGIFHYDFTVRFTDVTDGTSNTIMIGERPPGPRGRYGGWYANWGDCTCPVAQIHPAQPVPGRRADGSLCPTGAVLAPGRIDDVCSLGHFWSLHSGGANFAFADGSVRFLSYSADPLMPALATRAGGEAVSVPE